MKCLWMFVKTVRDICQTPASCQRLEFIYAADRPTSKNMTTGEYNISNSCPTWLPHITTRRRSTSAVQSRLKIRYCFVSFRIGLSCKRSRYHDPTRDRRQTPFWSGMYVIRPSVRPSVGHVCQPKLSHDRDQIQIDSVDIDPIRTCTMPFVETAILRLTGRRLVSRSGTEEFRFRVGDRRLCMRSK